MKKTPFIQILLSLSILAVICAFTVACEVGAYQIPVMILVLNALMVLSAIIGCAIVLLLCWWAYQWWEKHPSYGVAETSFNIFLNNRRKARMLKNAAQVILPLQIFFYGVLLRNKDILGINPGADPGSLSPNGVRMTFRNGAIYYVLESIVSEELEQDTDTIQQTGNQCIVAELNNYGAENLSSTFLAQNGKTYPSVYLDRLTMDSLHHKLIFELLYVGSNQAVNALEKAWLRDRPQAPKAEVEVFDDEV